MGLRATSLLKPFVDEREAKRRKQIKPPREVFTRDVLRTANNQRQYTKDDAGFRFGLAAGVRVAVVVFEVGSQGNKKGSDPLNNP